MFLWKLQLPQLHTICWLSGHTSEHYPRLHKSCKTCKPACSHRETSGATFWSELIKVTSAGGAIGPQRHIWCHILPFFWSMTFLELQNCGYFRKHNQNWPVFVFLTLLCIVLGLCCQIMSRITLFSCQILCRESRCFGATFQPREKWLVPQKGFLWGLTTW